MKLWAKKTPTRLQPVGVCLDGVRDALESTRFGQLVLGLGETGPMMLDLDYSHVLIVGEQFAGTSVVLRTMLAQVLADGAEVVIVDRSHNAHRWADGHPDVTQVWALDQIATELLRLGAELERRRAVAETDILTARRLVLGIENRAGLAEALQERWFELSKGAGPKKAPAVEALTALEDASPMLGIHLVATTSSGAWMPATTRAPYRVRITSSCVGEVAWPIFTDGLSRPLEACAGRPGMFWVMRGATQVPLTALHLTPMESQHLVAALIAADRQIWGAA